MKRILMIALTAMLFIGTSFAGNPESTGKEVVYKIDTKASKVLWTGKKVTGQHTGELMLNDGNVTVSGNELSSTSVIMDMTSINCTDIKDAKTNGKLVGHLKSEDFFGVENHPKSSFIATSVTPIQGSKDGEANYTVNGDLTIKGITHEISFPAVVNMNGGIMTANGAAEFDRTKYNIKYGSGSFFDSLGDKMIYDDVKIQFVLVAKTQ